MKYKNLDSDESIFFERELQHVKAKTYDIRFPELKHRTLIPVDTSAPSGSDTVKYDQFDQTGIAQIVANYADDLERADVSAKEFVGKVKSLALSYGWNLQELRSAAMTGKPLTTRKSGAAKRGHLVTENRIVWFGDADHGLQGIFDNPNISVVVLPADGSGSSTAWADKTPDQIIRDINLMTRTPHAVSKGVEMVDTLLLPITQYNLIFDTPRSAQSDMSIARWVMANNPHLKAIDWLNELEGTGPANADQMLSYHRSPDKLQQEIPQDFEQLPVQEEGLEFVVPTHSRHGGVKVYYPLSMAKASGL